MCVVRSGQHYQNEYVEEPTPGKPRREPPFPETSLLQRVADRGEVVVPIRIAKTKSIESSEFANVCRKVALLRHCCVLEQYRKHEGSVAQTVRNLKPNGVVRQIKSSPTLTIERLCPAPANENEHSGVSGDLSQEVFTPGDTSANVFLIAKHATFSERLSQFSGESACNELAFGTPIVDEDPVHGALSCVQSV